jgi:immunoglobulin-like protein involved in spore germination
MAVTGVVRRRILLGAAALAVALAACVPPPPPHVPAVTIVEPAAGATVTSPMHVTGTASVFEAVFFLEVTDGVGTVLTTQRLMASCGTSCPGTFDTTVSFQSAPGPLTLTAYTLSAKDGSRIDETSVALVAG